MTDCKTIYHVCRHAEWKTARESGRYDGSSQDKADGFIHFSGPAQVVESVAKHRAGQDGLVLVAVDPGRLGPSLKWETSRGGALFPHLHGPLSLEAVKWVKDLPLDADVGCHVFPEIED
ncbi:DUF952 domain-containing protein [Paramagnetospirillum kuznetsovii]|uniref:DUF952 domain-containing protein n=1 Tax=Paramagnetospirillum kuznetsovii TaxID=2053833 RepID=A0A364P3N2_9PROT|nr:DUF952 domain-containing protein [Paramagnetospirillum kuznetsovii]RAU23949.1 DUF952 domain-containing protein [Paramagnetospirillum kuznetsovii]